MTKIDSLIFDMDGTLWDALDTYVWCWNEAYRLCGSKRVMTRNELIGHMGVEIEKILKITAPHEEEITLASFSETLYQTQTQWMAVKGGTIYEGVIEGIAELSKHYKILLLSNCEEGGLPMFMTYSGLTPYITDFVSYGHNQQPKHKNLLLLKERNLLENPIYIGDTAGDSKQTEMADMPFAFMRYGYGDTNNYQWAFDDFISLTRHFLALCKDK